MATGKVASRKARAEQRRIEDVVADAAEQVLADIDGHDRAKHRQQIRTPGGMTKASSMPVITALPSPTVTVGPAPSG